MGAPSRAVIFDVDGVLVDSYQAHFESWRELCQEHGIELTEAEFARTFGRTSAEILEELWPHSLSTERISELDDHKESLYRDIVGADFPAMEGAADLIRALHEAGFALAVGSSGPPENVALALEQLGVDNEIDARVTGRDVRRGKPDPQVFTTAAERLGVPSHRCIVVEDAPAGVQAAHAAGMRCVGVASTGRTRDELLDAELVVESLRGLGPADFAALLD